MGLEALDRVASIIGIMVPFVSPPFPFRWFLNTKCFPTWGHSSLVLHVFNYCLIRVLVTLGTSAFVVRLLLLWNSALLQAYLFAAEGGSALLVAWPRKPVTFSSWRQLWSAHTQTLFRASLLPDPCLSPTGLVSGLTIPALILFPSSKRAMWPLQQDRR